MSEATDLQLLSWAQRSSNLLLDPTYFQSTLFNVNIGIMRADREIQNAPGMEGIGFIDQSNEILDAGSDLQTLKTFVENLPSDISTLLDHPLFLAFANGPTGALSKIHTEDITTGNTTGTKGSAPDPDGFPTEYTLPSLSFTDFTGADDGPMDIHYPVDEDFRAEFEAGYKSWLDNPNHGEDLDFDDFIKQVMESGEYDHQGYHPVWDFVNSVLDASVIWPIIKAIRGSDPVTGDEYDGWEAALGVGMSVIELIALVTAGVTDGASVLAAGGVRAALSAAVKAAAKVFLFDMLVNTGSVITYDLAVSLGLPTWAAGLIAMGVGFKMGKEGARFFIQRLDEAGNPVGDRIFLEMIDPEGATQRTVAQDGRTFTDEDVKAAYEKAPRNADGVAVDWRTGEPLRANGPGETRNWYMRWDPDHNRWVAENPGPGHEMPASGLPPTGKPNSYGYDEHGFRLPYANSRPDYTDEQIIEVWNRAKRPSAGYELNADKSKFYYEEGDVIVMDIKGNWRKVEWEPGQPGPRPWDMGHVRGQEYAALHEAYMNGDIKLPKFLEEYRNPDNYQVEDPIRNRSRKDEQQG